MEAMQANLAEQSLEAAQIERYLGLSATLRTVCHEGNLRPYRSLYITDGTQERVKFWKNPTRVARGVTTEGGDAGEASGGRGSEMRAVCLASLGTLGLSRRV